MKRKLGFVGLGVMGKPMAKNLLRAGYQLTVCDIDATATKELEIDGATVAQSPCELARASEVVLTMLPDSPEVKQVYLGDNGLLAGAKEGIVLIDSSTIHPETTKEIGMNAAKIPAHILDAPVGGGVVDAINGNLIMLVGGDRDVMETCRDILETVGERVIYAGPLGAGECLKLTNNLMTGIYGCLLAEGFSFAERVGVDKENMYELLKANLMRLFEVLSTKIMKKDFSPGFQTKLMHKDLRIVQDLAQYNGAPLPLGSLVKELYQFALNRGLNKSDFSSVSSLYDCDSED